MKRVFLATLLLLVILLSTPLIQASEIDQERVDLFLASQKMLTQEKAPPRMKIGMVLSTLGTDSEVTVGARVELRLDRESTFNIITETTYLKGEQTLAGFVSFKFAPFAGNRLDAYIGAGVGYAEGFRYQAFAGIDITKHFFAEARYVNHSGGIANSRVHLATGFQFTY